MTDLPSIPTDARLFETPVFLGHGTAEEKVNVKLGKPARDTLLMLGFSVEWFPYEGFVHWWKTPDEIDDVVSFLYRKIGVKITDEKPPPT